jgi:hypothetical protein
VMGARLSDTTGAPAAVSFPETISLFTWQM